MVSYSAKVIDPVGLHARPAAIVVSEACKHKNAEIELVYNGNKANVKSIMNLLSLGIKTNSQITINCLGKDAEKACASLYKIMKKNNIIE